MDLIYFYTPGACSLSGMVVLEWTAVPYHLCRVDREVRSTDAFKRVNPQGKVPALRVGTRFLAENGAILARLAHGRADLLPAEGSEDRDQVNQWLSYLASGFHVAFYPYFLPSRYLEDAALHPAIKDAALKQIRRQLAFVDGQLEGRPYLLGPSRTVLDPYLYGMSRWARPLCDLPGEFPNVARHQARMEEDPALRFALSIERDEPLKSPSGAFKGHVDLATV